MKKILPIILGLLLCACVSKSPDGESSSRFPGVDLSKVPGTVVTHLPATSEHYLGSPCIVIMPNGKYVVSYDINSWDKSVPLYDKTVIFESSNKGKTWTKLTELMTQHWSTLFYHNNSLYIIGTYAKNNNAHIQKSLDGGKTWTSPHNENTGVLAVGEYHCASVPVIVYNGRIWRAFEVQRPGSGRQSVMFSAPADADLLERSNWTFSNILDFNNSWLTGANGWIEGNAVVTPEGKIVNIIRVQATSGSDDEGGSPVHSTAAMIHISKDGKTASFDPKRDFINLPGGSGKKFTIRFDPLTKKYWSLTNWIQPKDLKYLEITKAGRIRNTMALISSTDLRKWEVNSIILHIPFVIDPSINRAKYGFQYADWKIEGDDMVAVFRTGFEDGLGGPRNYHDANFITFHRITNFRGRTMEDLPLNK